VAIVYTQMSLFAFIEISVSDDPEKCLCMHMKELYIVRFL